MSKHTNLSTLKKAAIVVTLPLLVIFSGYASAEMELSAEQTAEIAQRLKPVGSVKTTASAAQAVSQAVAAPVAPVAETAPEPAAVDGAKVYQTACFACHGTGAAGAPRLGNADEWAARLEQGIEVLNDNALNGFNTMPARGGNMALTDDAVKAAVAHMVAAVQ